MAGDAPRTLGMWTLLSPLGSGGMGVVWRAEGPGGLVAIKVLEASASQPDARRRFEREGRALMNTTHPNVVRAYDFGQGEDGSMFLVMEILEGRSLEDELLARGSFPAQRALVLLRQAVAGLGAAHAAGVVHRDVKPGNLFLCRDGMVKVIDFGLALPIAREGLASRLTSTGALMGTPSYMAPEQATGEGKEDERTDVWALGAVLHHLLAGHPPFYTPGPPLVELVRILTESPDPLPRHVPESCAAIVARALRKDPTERFSGMAELDRAIEEALGLRAGAAVSASDVAGSAPVEAQGAAPGEAPVAAPDAALEPLVARPPPETLAQEVRLVAVVLASACRGAALAGFLRSVQALGGSGVALAEGRALGVFGGQEWLGDEARRALGAAWRARPFAAALGVGTGKAIVGTRGESPAGDALTAATAALEEAAAREAAPRPAAEAPVGACPETRRRVQGGYDFDGALVRGPRPGGRVVGPREIAGVEVPFVGRALELERLLGLVDRATAERRACVALVVGPPGIGKSRLRHEVKGRIVERTEVRCLEARAEPADVLRGHAPFRRMIEQLCALRDGVPAEEGRARLVALATAAGLDGERGREVAEFLGELVETPFPTGPHLGAAQRDGRLMRDQIRLALVELFAGWTARDPVVLLFEDLQWADAGSLELLDLLLQRLGERPLAVLATARPEIAAREVEALAQAEHVELQPLPAEDTATIVQRILGHGDDELVDRAAGNPYFAEELALLRRQQGPRRDGAAREALPATVEGAVQARLDALPSAEKDLLKRVAVFGPRFWTEGAEAVGVHGAHRLLVSLRHRDVVVPRSPGRFAGQREWSFRHAVEHEVARALLTPEQARALHAAAARWLATQADAPPEEIAEHHEQAGEPGPAGALWLRAVRAAERRGSTAEVVAYARRVLGPKDGGPALGAPERHELLLAQASAEAWLGRPASMVPLLDAARALETEADVPALSRANRLRVLAGMLSRTGSLPEAIAAAREAVRYCDAVGAEEAGVGARAYLAEALAKAGDLDEAASVAGAIPARAGDALRRGVVSGVWGLIASKRGDPVEALRWRRAEAQAVDEAGNVRHGAITLAKIGASLLVLGDHAQAHQVLLQALPRARALGQLAAQGWIQLILGLVLARLGDPAAGKAAEDEALRIARVTRRPSNLGASALIYRSLIAREAGDPDGAIADALRALAELGEYVTLEVLARTTHAAALFDAGRHAEAAVECDRALTMRAELGGMEELEIDLLLVHHDLSAASGDGARAAAALDEAARVFARAQDALARDPALRDAHARNIPANRRLRTLLERRASG